MVAVLSFASLPDDGREGLLWHPPRLAEHSTQLEAETSFAPLLFRLVTSAKNDGGTLDNTAQS